MPRHCLAPIAAPLLSALVSTLSVSLLCAQTVHAQSTPSSGLGSPAGPAPAQPAPAQPPPAQPTPPPPPPAQPAPAQPAQIPAAPPPAGAPQPGGYPTAGYPSSRPGGAMRIPPRIAARLRTLETDLNLLAARGGNRILDGVISLVAGGAFLTIGIVIRANNDEDDDTGLAPSSNLLSSLLMVTGGVALGRGVVELAVRPNPKDAALEYSHMPMISVQQVKERLSFGENALKELAYRSRVARSLDGSLTVLGGVALPLIYSVQRDESAGELKKDWTFWVMMVGSTISVIGGAVTLLTRSDAEKRWRAYQRMKSRLLKERDQQQPGGSEFSFQLTPVVTPNAAGLGASIRF